LSVRRTEENAMTSTHISLYYHFIFSTKERRPTIKEDWEGRLHGYLGGILRGMNGVAEAVGGTDDHVHILASLRAIHSPAEVLRDLKANSTNWVRGIIANRWFGWQDGYGAFTVGRREIDAVRAYITNQKEHHRKMTFQEEYIRLLEESGIEFNRKYLW
jgi:putative transposase